VAVSKYLKGEMERCLTCTDITAVANIYTHEEVKSTTCLDEKTR
jgi:hypothetical protein